MHIELTDLLRCPEEHDEAFVVLLPDQMQGRNVTAGHLGCPVCGWSTAWSDGIPDFGGGDRSSAAPPCEASAAAVLLGLNGPGGWLALVGGAGALASDLTELLPGISLVAINPPADTTHANVLLSGRWPLKSQSLRGVVVGSDAEVWNEAALRSVLPGLRAVGTGEPPTVVPGAELLASADGVWVVRRR